MDIYIKPIKKISIAERKIVYLKDIAEVFSVEGNVESIKNTIVLKIKEDSEKSYLLSVIDVIKAITNGFPEFTITNVGEMDVIVEYSPERKRDRKWLVYLKVAVIFVILFAGASTAIMSFHSDAEMPSILRNYYYIFFREYVDNPVILVVPYSIGLAVGIIVFFNHFSKLYVTKDPTPIEVQMTTYEKETVANMVDTLEKEKQQKSGGKK